MEKLVHYRKLHEEIIELELSIKRAAEKKDELVTELLLARADEEMMMANLTMTYGPGKLDVRNMEWVSETKETGNDGHINGN